MFISLGVQCASRFWIAVIFEWFCRVTLSCQPLVFTAKLLVAVILGHGNSWLIVRIGPQTKVWPKNYSNVCFNDLSRTRLICQFTNWFEKQISLIMIQINWFFFYYQKSNTSLLLNKEKVSVPIFVIALIFSPECVLRRKNATWVWMRMSKVCERFHFWVNYSSGVLREF